MALYHFSAQMISRSTGRSATAAAAYRSGQEITDQRTGEVHDYSRKGGVVHSEVLAPDGAASWVFDRSALWNAVEVAEKRKDAQLAREVEVALPRELGLSEQVDLLRGFVQEHFVSRGMVADIAVHEVKARDGERQPHAHVMLTTRQLAPEGFGGKAREWNDRALLEGWREGWAIHVNQTLERSGHEQRVDHRSLAAQRAEALEIANDNARPETERAQASERADELDREPLPTVSLAVIEMERQGIRTERGNQLREVQARNAERASLRQQLREVTHQLAEITREIAAKAKELAVGVANRVKEAAGRKAPAGQTETQRIERMSAADLRAEIDKTRPPPVDQVVAQRPEIIEAAKTRQVLGEASDTARRRLLLAQREIRDWRERHPKRAAAHDRGWLKVPEYAGLETKLAQADDANRKAEASQQAHERAEGLLLASARAEVQAAQSPALARVARLQAALAPKEAQERVDRMVQEARAPDIDREQRTGKVIKVDEKYVWQDIGGNQALKHDRVRFGTEVPTPGEKIRVRYNNGTMTLERHLDRSRGKDRGG
jgi:ATP-dependent exoDNAse (exonuclease V) alpha subunit